MQLIVVEQQLERAVSRGRFEAVLETHAWCRDAYGVHHVHTLLAPAARRMICVFRAPDAEVVRSLARRMGFAYERAYAAELVTTRGDARCSAPGAAK